MATVSVELDLDVPDGVTIFGCERHESAFVFEVGWEWPARCTCPKCGLEQAARYEHKNDFRVIRDLEICGQPSFWTYQVVFHRCTGCNHRQELLPPFRRARAQYTYRFEQLVIRMAIGSTAEDVGRRLGVSAEMVEGILENWINEERAIDPARKITDVGLDELSLKKGHKMYVTIMTDLTDPKRPQVLAVQAGRGEEAAARCLQRLAAPQREQVRTHRTDMCKAYPAACAKELSNSQHVADRFHVAKRLGDVVDALRKKSPALTSVA